MAKMLRIPLQKYNHRVFEYLSQSGKDVLVVTSTKYYLEGSRSVRIVSTSQLEAIHSKLRKRLGQIVSI
ncbi:Hypothetical protein PHPALM_3151 [Phytophthora palmivora]|uniref:Uncharacterized protein n=1 Tax=Phytophthora palmivora TaxID=4796 RepID=A0A2P4YN34_9STRA|nr:Hypothetical protein PHPALM_3151 [Phytophthora palmivora]